MCRGTNSGMRSSASTSHDDPLSHIARIGRVAHTVWDHDDPLSHIARIGRVAHTVWDHADLATKNTSEPKSAHDTARAISTHTHTMEDVEEIDF